MPSLSLMFVLSMSTENYLLMHGIVKYDLFRQFYLDILIGIYRRYIKFIKPLIPIRFNNFHNL